MRKAPVQTDRDGMFRLANERVLSLVRGAGWNVVSLSFDRAGYRHFETNCPLSAATNRPSGEPVLDVGRIMLQPLELFRQANGLPVLTAVFDPEAQPLPQFIQADYIELSKIAAISKFRSGEGHDYSDDFESCRSMKHYFQPGTRSGWATVKIFSPVEGVVFRTEEEWAGTKIDIQVESHPAFIVTLFHVRLHAPLRPGDKVAAGQALGSHFGNQTCSDIAVNINTPKGRKLVSYFDVMPDQIFEQYRARGLASRAEAVISKERRDADPLSCRNGKFTTHSRGEDWLMLQPLP